MNVGPFGTTRKRSAAEAGAQTGPTKYGYGESNPGDQPEKLTAYH